MMVVRAAYVLPSLPGLGLVNDDSSVEIIDFGAGDSLRADGIVAQELARRLRGERCSALLQSVPLVGDVSRLLGAIEAQPAFRVTPASALRLEGFDTLFLELTGTCNERCLHCYAGSGPEVHTALSYGDCRNVVRDAADLGFRRVQLTGGEPLACSFVVDLVADITDCGMVCEIYTNGTLLRDMLLARLRSFQPSFAVSFYSHRADVHDRITQMPGSQQRTLQAIERLVAAGLEVRASIVVMQANAADVTPTIELLHRLGVAHVTVAASRAVGRGRVYGADASGGEVVSGGGHRPAADNAALLSGSLCVASDGRVYPCIFNRDDPLGQLQDRTLREIARAPHLKSMLDAAPSPLEVATRCGDQLQCRSCRLIKTALRVCS